MTAIETSVENHFSTTLTASVSNTDTTFPVATLSTLTSPCLIEIDPESGTDREIVYCDGTFGANSFVTSNLSNRGLAGSVAGAVAHDSGTVVVVTILAQHLEDIHDRIDLAETTHALKTGAAFSGNITPSTNGGADLGTVALPWNNGHIKHLHTQEAIIQKFYEANISGSTTILAANGGVQILTMTGNVTDFVLGVPATGDSITYTVILKQDATGGRTLTFNGTIDWAGGTAPTVSSAANAVDVFTFLVAARGAGYDRIGIVGGLAMS